MSRTTQIGTIPDAIDAVISPVEDGDHDDGIPADHHWKIEIGNYSGIHCPTFRRRSDAVKCCKYHSGETVVIDQSGLCSSHGD